MDTLFAREPDLPPGFRYFPDFITEEEEAELLKEISIIELQVFNFQGYMAKRKVASFGYDYSFEKRSLSRGKDIPQKFYFLIEKVAKALATPPIEFAEVL